MDRFDAVVIGTGQAGPPLARRFAAAGWRVAIVEQGRFGGTCVNTGCTPTKAMVASAYAVHTARRGEEFGFSSGAVTVNWDRIRTRKDAIAGASRSAVERSLRQIPNVTVIQGRAQLASATEVVVGEQRLQAARIFLNVGGRPAVPPIPGIERVPYLTSDDIMDLETLPERLVIIGGSYVGLEFAQMFRRFGSQVVVVDTASRLATREDPEISECLKQILETEQIEIVLSAADCSIDRQGSAVALHHRGGLISGSHLLVATGRRPNTDRLGLEQAGVEVNERGFIVTDDRLQTGVPGIWALGDCNGRGAFTHTSYNEGDIVASNLLDGTQRSVNDRITAYALYTDPPLGRAGMTEAEARAAGHRILVGTLAMEDVSRAYEKSETQGLMKVVVDRDSGLFLGAAFLGTAGDEVVHCVLDAMYGRTPYHVLRTAMHIHPTVAEFIPSLLDDLRDSDSPKKELTET